MTRAEGLKLNKAAITKRLLKMQKSITWLAAELEYTEGYVKDLLKEKKPLLVKHIKQITAIIGEGEWTLKK